jgi:site-specific recombinase XerD
MGTAAAMSEPKPAVPPLVLEAAGRDRLACPGADELFQRWFASHPRKLSDQTLMVYRHAWNAYLKFLAAQPTQPLAWPEASSATIEAYLSAVAPLRKGDGAVSPVTQRRYWRILRDIYGYALIYQWVPSNPLLAARHPHSEVMASLRLPEWAMIALESQLSRECEDSALTWQAQRDRAMLALMLCTAPKTGELIALKASGLGSDAQRRPVSVQLHGPRGVQLRRIVLSECARTQLALWLQVRADITGLPETLFFGQKRVPGTALRRELTRKTVFTIVMSFLDRALPPGSFEHGLYHQGAELIRNAVIARWLDDPLQTVGDMAQVMARAGVSDRRTIERLAKESIVAG